MLLHNSLSQRLFGTRFTPAVALGVCALLLQASAANADDDRPRYSPELGATLSIVRCQLPGYARGYYTSALRLEKWVTQDSILIKHLRTRPGGPLASLPENTLRTGDVIFFDYRLPIGPHLPRHVQDVLRTLNPLNNRLLSIEKRYFFNGQRRVKTTDDFLKALNDSSLEGYGDGRFMPVRIARTDLSIKAPSGANRFIRIPVPGKSSVTEVYNFGGADGRCEGQIGYDRYFRFVAKDGSAFHADRPVETLDRVTFYIPNPYLPENAHLAVPDAAAEEANEKARQSAREINAAIERARQSDWRNMDPVVAATIGILGVAAVIAVTREPGKEHTICNETKRPIHFAAAKEQFNMGFNPNVFTPAVDVEGPFTLNPGECHTRNVAQGLNWSFAFYTKATDGFVIPIFFQGPDERGYAHRRKVQAICVNTKSSFRQTFASADEVGRSCPADARLVPVSFGFQGLGNTRHTVRLVDTK